MNNTLSTSRAFGPQNLGEKMRALADALNAGDVDNVVSAFASDYEGLDVGAAQPQRGRDALREAMLGYLRGFPDLRLTIEQIIIQDNCVALTWTARGTHRGSLLNIPATGRRVVVSGSSMLVVENGQIQRGRHIWDMAGLLRAIGLLPEL